VPDPADVRRPWLRGDPVVLRRGRGAVQLGVDDDRVMVVEPCPAAVERLLGELDGRHDRAALLRSAARGRVPPGVLDDLLRQLARAGLLADGRDPPPPVRTVRLAGDGELGRAIAALLTGAPDVRLELADAPAAGPGSTDLEIVATDRLEVDRVLTDALLRADRPHLLARASGAGALVGPLVLPGRTPCVRCTDLIRRDLDRAWPALLAQLVRLPGRMSRVQVGWAAATAAVQAWAYLDRPDSPPETAGGTVELTADHLVRWRRWPIHPECGCSWLPAAD
jgi:hypothetical protein